jgi:hypothetical protein
MEVIKMTKLEEKLIELGYDGLYVSLNKVIWYKYPTKFTIIQLTVEGGKIIEVEYGERFWHLLQTFNRYVEREKTYTT